MKTVFCIALAAVLLAACGTTRERAVAFEPDPSLEFDRCISISRIARTKVLDDRNVLFYMRGGDIYRNFLPHRCPGLSNREAFSYRTSVSQLCNTDVITVLDTTGFGPRPGASCGLGGFYPITEIEVERLETEIERIRELNLGDME